MSKMVDALKVRDYMIETFRGVFDPKGKIEMEVRISSGEPGLIYEFTGRHPFKIDETITKKEFMTIPVESEDIIKLIKKLRDQYLGIEEF